MIYGLIFCAGHQSRFSSDIPKALVPYGDATLLDKNIENMSLHCDKVFVVCSEENKHWFNSYSKIVINSGLGCGDAVWKALKKLSPESGDTCFIQWGDCLHLSLIYALMKNSYDGKCVIPCVHETTPYVQLVPEDDGKVRVLFSKYSEPVSEGLHDLSVFYTDVLIMLEYLDKFHKKIAIDNGYVHKHNNEMLFLDVFNETTAKAQLLVIPGYKDNSFNTMEEFTNLELTEKI